MHSECFAPAGFVNESMPERLHETQLCSCLVDEQAFQACRNLKNGKAGDHAVDMKRQIGIIRGSGEC